MSRLYIAYRPVTPEPPDPTAAMEPETKAYMNALAVGYDATIYFASTAFERTGIQWWIAVNDFYVSLKELLSLTLGVSNLTTIFDCMYSFMGGTSALCKFNMINPADTDAAFRLSFSGGWTFDGGGATPNGSNGYANTHWESASQATSTRIAYGKYMRVADTTGVHGVWDLTNATRIYDQINTAAGSFTLGNTGGIATTTPFTRFHALKCTAAATKAISNFAVQTNAGAISYTTLDKPFYIGARNNNNASVNQYTNGQIGFYFLTGKYEFSDAEVISINTIVNQFMTDLGRNV